MQPLRQSFVCPDVVEPASVVLLLPLRLSIAPPSVDFFRRRICFAQHIAPVARVLRAGEAFHLFLRVRDDPQHFLVVPHIVGKGSNVEVAEQDAGFLRFGIGEVLAHFFDEVEFVCKLRIFLGIGDIAPRRHIEVMQVERCVRQRDSSEEMASIFSVAKGDMRGSDDRILGKDGNAVIGFLAPYALVEKAHVGDIAVWKQRVFHLCFLQTENIGAERRRDAREQGQAEAHRVDIPSGDTKRGRRHKRQASTDSSANEPLGMLFAKKEGKV